MTYEVPIDLYIPGRFEWDGEDWSFNWYCKGPVVFEPLSFRATFGNPIAKSCRQNWIEKYHHLFSMPVYCEDVHAVRGGFSIEGHKGDASDFVFGMSRYGPLEHHVSLPALQIGASVGQVSPFAEFGHLFSLMWGDRIGGAGSSAPALPDNVSSVIDFQSQIEGGMA